MDVQGEEFLLVLAFVLGNGVAGDGSLRSGEPLAALAAKITALPEASPAFAFDPFPVALQSALREKLPAPQQESQWVPALKGWIGKMLAEDSATAERGVAYLDYLRETSDETSSKAAHEKLLRKVLLREIKRNASAAEIILAKTKDEALKAEGMRWLH